MDELASKVCSGYQPYLSQKQPAKALEYLKQFRVLCAHRQGTWGVAQVNQWVESVLIKMKLIEKHGEWYAGRPVMITGNHYSIGLVFLVSGLNQNLLHTIENIYRYIEKWKFG